MAKSARKRRAPRRITAVAISESLQNAGSWCGITNLPSELLDLIIQLVGDEDLLSLAVLCKRLNSLAIRLYFSRMGMQNSFLYLFSFQPLTPFHALKGVRLSLQHQTFRSINCSFSSNFIAEMREVQRTLEKISTLNTLMLNFGYTHVNLTSRQSSTSLSLLLDALQGKSCNTLNILVSGSTFFPPISARLLTDLEAVSLHSTSPLFCNWISQSLNASKITKLYISDDGETNTPTSLASLQLPSLNDFYISSIKLAATDLITFLARHASISSLYIDLQKPHLPRKSQPCLLPRMVNLTSTPDMITYWLSYPETVPEIRTIRLLTAQWGFRMYGCLAKKVNFRSLREVLSLIAKRNNIQSLSLTLEACPEMNRLLQLGKNPRAASVDKRSFHHVTHLTVSEATDVLHLIPPWLKLFPNLEILVIDSFLNPKLKTRSQKASFVKSIHESCPTVRTIAFGLVHTPVAQWLTDTEGC